MSNYIRLYYICLPIYSKPEKTDNNRLTAKPSGTKLANVPGHSRYNEKQTKGGKVHTKPPNLRGFFMPEKTPGGYNLKPRVVRNSKPHGGNTYSVSFRTLEGSRQSNCQNFKQTKENTLMIHSTHTGLVAPRVVMDALDEAKTARQTIGRGNAYHQLLNAFHAEILPTFLVEAQGSFSETARLLGIHRETVRLYATQAGLVVGGDV
jgi:DNA-binding protein Fis